MTDEPVPLLEQTNEHLGNLIRRLQQIAVGIFMEETKEYSVTPVQCKALRAIKALPGITKSQLADAVAQDRSTTGELVLRLERRGLIKRTIALGDRRVRQLNITPKGDRLLAEVEPAIRIAKDRILAPLSESDARRFTEMIVRLVETNNQYSRAPLREMAKKKRKRKSDDFLQ